MRRNVFVVLLMMAVGFLVGWRLYTNLWCLPGSLGALPAALDLAAYRVVQEGWTRFPAQANVVTSFWSRVAGSPTKEGSAVPQLSWTIALLCLAGLSAACWTVAALRLRRMDIA